MSRVVAPSASSAMTSRAGAADQLGVNPFVLHPGEPMAMYHWKQTRSAFLVVSGDAVLIVEARRAARAWDFVHPRRARST